MINEKQFLGSDKKIQLGSSIGFPDIKCNNPAMEFKRCRVVRSDGFSKHFYFS